MKAYRVGGSWGVTIVEVDPDEPRDERGRAPSDRLMGMALTREDADLIVAALNTAARMNALQALAGQLSEQVQRRAPGSDSSDDTSSGV